MQQVAQGAQAEGLGRQGMAAQDGGQLVVLADQRAVWCVLECKCVCWDVGWVRGGSAGQE